MKSRMKQFPIASFVFTFLYLCLDGKNIVFTTMIYNQSELNSLTCDVLSYLVDSLVKETDQEMELLIVLPDSMLFCAIPQFTPFSNGLVAIRSCSEKIWNITAHLCSSRSAFFFLICGLQDSVTILTSAFQRLILRFRWFIFYDSSITADEQLLNSLSTFNFRVDSFLMLVDVNDNNSIQEAYKLSGQSNFVRRPASHWDVQGENYRDLQGMSLRVTGVLDTHYEFDTKIAMDAKGFPVFQPSFTFDLLEALTFSMNFTVQPMVSNTWGDFDHETQKWDGMIADLLNGEADLAISSTSDLPFRRRAVDFNMPTNTLKLAGFFKKPRAAVDAKALVEPFKGSFWFAIFFAIVCLSSVLVAFKLVLLRANGHSNSFSHIFNDGESMKMDLKRLDTVGSRHNFSGSSRAISEDGYDPLTLWSPCDCVQWALAVFCFQGFYNIPKYTCYRIVIGLGCLSGVLIYGAYAGTLISFLSVAVNSLTNIDQLVANSYVLSIVGANISLRFFRDSPSTMDRVIYQRRRLNPVYNGLNEAKQELLSGSFVFFGDQISGYNALKNFSVRESCSIQDLAIPFAKQKQGSMVPKDSPYRRMIDFQILRMTERGLMHQLNKRFMPSRIPCGNVATFSGVQLTSLTVAFAILIFGAVLSCLVIIIENGRNRLAIDDYKL